MTGAGAQSLAAVPFAASDLHDDTHNDTAALASSDIVTMLREQFRVARNDSVRIADAVLNEAQHQAMSPVLLLAVMSIESGFDRHAVSSAGARGLMQILPSAHPRLIAHAKDLSDPTVNVRIGSTILRDYLDAADGDLDAALFRYSGGGRGYARKVMSQMKNFNARLYPTSSVRAQPDDARVLPVRYGQPTAPSDCNTSTPTPGLATDCTDTGSDS
ncbi:transglycosylase SLT domain-containing protein [Paraburkholderia sp.]|uniref:transglycosylase SLT domain-containing protein n=1 Tax=Paraburkholderia sp. TaxID=1926495 RepID=UPI003D6FB5D2